MSSQIRRQEPLPDGVEQQIQKVAAQYPDTDMTQRKLSEATARVHRHCREQWAELPAEGPIAAAGTMLVFTIEERVWEGICDEMRVYGQSRAAAGRVMRLAALHAGRCDAYESEHAVREMLAPDDRVALVVHHP